MSAVVQVVALDRPVNIKRVEAGGDVVTLQPGEHETFTVRPHEKLEILGDEAFDDESPREHLSGKGDDGLPGGAGLPGEND